MSKFTLVISLLTLSSSAFAFGNRQAVAYALSSIALTNFLAKHGDGTKGIYDGKQLSRLAVTSQPSSGGWVNYRITATYIGPRDADPKCLGTAEIYLNLAGQWQDNRVNFNEPAVSGGCFQ